MQTEKSEKISANSFSQVYEALGIDLAKLGCVMLDVKAPEIELPKEYQDALYKSENPARHWIDGYTFEKAPHLTLLYGLMKPASEYKEHIDTVLEGWKCPTTKVWHVSFFNSPYEDDPYYCIIARMELSPELVQGNRRLELLPHINTYLDYKPHVTIAYIKKDEAIRNSMIGFFQAKLKGRTLKVTGINLGDA